MSIHKNAITIFVVKSCEVGIKHLVTIAVTEIVTDNNFM